MTDTIKNYLTLIVVIIAAISIAYLYFSADIFSDILKKPIRLVSWGMMAIDIGVLLVVLVSYETAKGIEPVFYGISLSSSFYVFYVMGSVLIVSGARKFTHR